MKGALRLAALLLLPAAAGCGKSVGTVSGTVTYKGKPLASGEVIFLCADGKATTRAAIGPDGTYLAKDVPTGPAKLGVSNPPLTDVISGGGVGIKAPADDPEVKELKERAARYVPTPAKYADPEQSGLTYTVTRGEQKHDISLP